MPFSSGVSDAASAAALVEDDWTMYNLPDEAIPAAPRSTSLRRVASLEHLQKRIHGDVNHSVAASTLSEPQVTASDK
ncbi:hypothetical protein GUJ93_ZPchr0009g379 [Zizania palustris]|uniref:Basic leucine-zipper C-terminal domain-containing protein n=1 Tax=Zizania palustris TaxID=103762 RepID=A0A8J5RN90_ZIZPA|nr:hypothetical protein GUJ93_ZPchr0009g379 [Zizania palustris]